MIAQLKGIAIDVTADTAKTATRLVVDVNGVGYEVWLTLASEPRVRAGQPVTVLVSESVTAFDGATTLYGFLTREEKDLFIRLRENVDGMGPRKALESLDKISKSLPDFRRAIIEGDQRLLVSVFGFTKKTAEKLVVALKDKMDGWAPAGPTRWQEAPKAGPEADTVAALLSLGYDDAEARDYAAKARAALGDKAGPADLVKEALRAAARA